MTRYHINPETGRPNQCTAQVRCRFGAATEHFDSKEAARAGYEKQMESQTVSESLKKNSKATSKTPSLGFKADDVSRASEEVERLSGGVVSLHTSDWSDGDSSELLVVFNNGSDQCMVIEQAARGKSLAYVGLGPDYRSIRQPLHKVLTSSRIDELSRPSESREGDPTAESKQIVQIINRVVNRNSLTETSAPVAAKTIRRVDRYATIPIAESAASPKAVPEPAPTKSRTPKKLPIIPGVTPVATKRELDEELSELQQDQLYGYTVQGLLQTRGIGLKQIEEAERSGDYIVETKVPSYYEVSISTDLARRELGLPARPKTGIDQDELRLAQINRDEAYAKTFGWFSGDESKKAKENYKAAKAEYDRIRATRGNSPWPN